MLFYNTGIELFGGSAMKCPYCNQEMVKGYVQSARPVFWSPEKKKLFFKPSLQVDFYVSKGFWNGCFGESQYCQYCKKVIISLEE
jgi:hypothetical protein